METISDQSTGTEAGVPEPASAAGAGDESNTTPEPPAKGEEHLGDAGKKALDTMKAERNQARAETRSLRDEVAALKAKIEGTEQEHAAALQRREVEEAALVKANERILKAEVRAAAASKLRDPADALRFLDLSELEVGSDGEVDHTAITALIDSLVTEKPYLAAQGVGIGSADAGARSSKPISSTLPSQSPCLPEHRTAAQVTTASAVSLTEHTTRVGLGNDAAPQVPGSVLPESS